MNYKLEEAQRKWDNSTLSDKTQQYFATLKCSYQAQCRFWNDWRAAFFWFRHDYLPSIYL